MSWSLFRSDLTALPRRQGTNSKVIQPNGKPVYPERGFAVKKVSTVAKGDHFVRRFRFQEERLAGHPGWWLPLLMIMATYADFRTGAYVGTYEGLRQALARQRIHVSYGAIRNAVDQLQRLGLLARDRAANIAGRRLMVILRLSVKQTIMDLMKAVADLVRRRVSRFAQRENARIRAAQSAAVSEDSKESVNQRPAALKTVPQGSKCESPLVRRMKEQIAAGLKRVPAT